MDLSLRAERAIPEAPAEAPHRRPVPTLWAVASGKGGVGKSVLSSSLAIGLSQSGPRVVAVDLDFGGANLHTLFGCERAPRTLADVLRGDVPGLEDALAPTTVPGVRLLSGARGTLDSANPNHSHKQRLLRELRRLDAGHVVLDLGAGSGFNTLDAFLAADRRLLVVTPEITAIENAYHFLKAAFFRSLRDVAREPGVREALVQVLEDARRRGATPRELIEAASQADARAGARLSERMRAFAVDLVVNRADLARSRDPGVEMVAACRAQLGASLRFAAALPSDESVPAAVARGVPVMQLFPGSHFCSEVSGLVDRLLLEEPAPTASPRPARASRKPAAPPAPELCAHWLPEFDGTSPGRYLRLCRELRGLSIPDLHKRTRIRHLERIEAERFDALPPEPYLRGFVRQYAEVLGISDAERVAERFLEGARASRGRTLRAAGSALRRRVLERKLLQRVPIAAAEPAAPPLIVRQATEPDPRAGVPFTDPLEALPEELRSLESAS